MNKKINFLTEKICNDTGGAIYDNYFYNKLINRYTNDVNVIQDSDFKKDIIKNNFIEFSKVYYKNYKKIIDCDVLILNSRLYTRFIILLILGKIKLSRCKIIMIHHHYNFMTHKGILKYIHKLFEISFLRKAEQIIIPNPYIVDLTKANKAITGEIVFLESSFKAEGFRISNGNNKSILFVGNVDRRKGLIYGIKAFKKFVDKNPGYIFNIVGRYDPNDSYYIKLKKYISYNNLDRKINFIGRVDDKELERYYEDAQFFLFPSLNEGFGWVMMEAMGHGLPVVAFNNTAIPYTVKNGVNGFLAENYNVNDLYYCMEKIIEDSDRFINLKEGALKTYNDSSKLENLSEKIDNYLMEIYSKKGNKCTDE